MRNLNRKSLIENPRGLIEITKSTCGVYLLLLFNKNGLLTPFSGSEVYLSGIMYINGPFFVYSFILNLIKKSSGADVKELI